MIPQSIVLKAETIAAIKKILRSYHYDKYKWNRNVRTVRIYAVINFKMNSQILVLSLLVVTIAG